MAPLNISLSNPFIDKVTKQSTAMTDNVIRSATTIFNELFINTLDAAKENVKIYSKAVDAATDPCINIARTWISLFFLHNNISSEYDSYISPGHNSIRPSFVPTAIPQ